MSGSAAVVGLVLLVSTLPGCGTNACDEGPGVDNSIASAERWVRVTSSPAFPDTEGTIDVAFRMVPVDVDHLEGSPRTETIGVHSSFLPGIEDGVASGDDVFVSLVSTQLDREMVATVIVRTPDGDHHMVGECTADEEGSLRERLGDRYDAAIDEVIGLTDPCLIKQTLSAGTC